MNHLFKKSLGLSIGLLVSIGAAAGNWQPVNNTAELKKLFTDTVAAEHLFRFSISPVFSAPWNTAR